MVPAWPFERRPDAATPILAALRDSVPPALVVRLRLRIYDEIVPDSSLEAYKRKRDFAKTPEPPPGGADDQARNLVFVVQQHAATRMHWDFRLEVDGVLKSWPLPKGPSLDPREKRMAVMVEDHPYEYRAFEGIIPKGEYGGGQVIVWDEGTYTPDEDGKTSWNDRDEGNQRMREGLKKGKLSIFMRGKKLRGSFTLVKTRYSADSWLLIKHRDEYVSDRDILEEDRSVRSGLTIRDLKEGRLPGARHDGEVAHPQARKAPFPDPRREAPMLSTLVKSAFNQPAWLWEPKLDGIRALAYVRDGKAELRSRRRIEVTKTYPSIARALEEQRVQSLVLDGEVCALDADGVPRFQLIQPRINLTRGSDIARAEAEIPVVYFVFDILYLDEHDLRNVPLEDRKRLLASRVQFGDVIRPVSYIEELGVETEAQAKRLGFEGVVGKRRDSRYEPGARSRSWVKVKAVNEQEFVVGGYTPGEGARDRTFGALAIGYYDDGKLVYAGNVGSGFNDAMLGSIRKQLEDLKTAKSPFEAGKVEGKVTWVEPRLVAQVKYAEWTNDGRLRAPVFLGLRDDIDPRQVGRERPVAASVVETMPAAAVQADGGSAPDIVSTLDDLLQQIEQPKQEFVVHVEGHRFKVTNLDKVFWPPYESRPPLTKRDLIRYYIRVAPVILPHLRDRPLTLTRYPNGIEGGRFYQKHYPQGVPGFVEELDIWAEHRDAGGRYLMCNNLATLVWLAQIADIEMHAWMARVDPEPDAVAKGRDFSISQRAIESSVLNYPDFLVFDLDPYIYSGKEKKGEEPELNPRGWQKTVETALEIKDLLDGLGLSSFVKTTGKTGLHVYVPIVRNLDYDAVRATAQTFGRFMVEQHPKEITVDWDVEKRRGKVFFDANQNTRGKTLAGPYSLRPTPWAGVSTPVLWSELPAIDPPSLTINSVPERIAKRGDPWADILGHKNDLSAVLSAVKAAT